MQKQHSFTVTGEDPNEHDSWRVTDLSAKDDAFATLLSMSRQ